MGMPRKTRYGAQPDGKRKRRKKKDEGRVQIEERRQKMNGKMEKPAEEQNKQSFREDPQV